MKKLNHYFQKGAIVFVIIMLITIPNLHVFSSIHSYQTSSPAITANKYYQSDHSRQTFALGGIGLMFLFFVGFAGLVTGGVLGANKVRHQQLHQLNSFDEVYAKYDFSEFDN